MKSGKKSPFRFSLESRTERESGYLEQLTKVFEESPFSTVEKLMNFPLFVPRQDLAKFLARAELFKRVLHVQGSIVECGVFFGGGLMTFAQLSAIFEPVNHQRKIIGFDTFSGFPRLSSKDARAESKDAKKGGLAIDSYGELRKVCALYDENRFVGHIPKIELVKGDAKETIPRYLKENPHLVISLLYLDFDLYEPTKVALEQFLPRIPKGGIIAFDELNLKSWAGETIALLETMDLKSIRLERFSFTSTLSFAQLD